jgi:hypothetical protein
MAKIITFIIFNFIAINSYAYLNMNIPMPDNADSFSKGFALPDNFMKQLLAQRELAQQKQQHLDNLAIQKQQARESIRIQRQEEAMRQLQMEIMREQLRQLKKNRH